MARIKLEIELLYLDLDVCQRCQGTDRNMEEAIAEVSQILKATGAEIEVEKSTFRPKSKPGNWVLSVPPLSALTVEISSWMSRKPCANHAVIFVGKTLIAVSGPTKERNTQLLPKP